MDFTESLLSLNPPWTFHREFHYFRATVILWTSHSVANENFLEFKNFTAIKFSGESEICNENVLSTV